MEQEKHTILQEMSFQRAAGWIAIIGTTTFVVGFFAFLLLSLWRAEEWMIIVFLMMIPTWHFKQLIDY
jgi:hypothetical protein